MTFTNHEQRRDRQQIARARADFAGTKYTAGLRQMTSPLTQRPFGDRVSARRLTGQMVAVPAEVAERASE